MARKLDALLDAPPLDRAWVGALVVSLRTGETWYARNASRHFTPASNAKLFTSAAALAYLGPDRRFTTRVMMGSGPGGADAAPDRGEVQGDLLLIGGGDPSLTDADLEDLARRTAQAGIRRVDGTLIVDTTLFRGPGRSPGVGWDWEDEADAAPASALTVDRGRVSVTVTAGARPGQLPTVDLAPASCGLALDVRAVTVAAGRTTALYVARRHGSPILEVRGTIGAGAIHADAVAVDDPADLAGRVFGEALARHGVRVRGTVRIATRDEATPGGPPDRPGAELARHESAPLSELLARMNLPSDNHYAETLLRQVGVAWAATSEGRAAMAARTDPTPPTSADLGLDAERALLSRLGIMEAEARLVDGSGLARTDLVTPHAIVRLLQAMSRDPNASVYFGSLPVAGRTGTLRRRMIGTPAEGNLRAKTGTLTGVSALSGRITTRSGETLLFSLLMNQFLGPPAAERAVQDRFCETLAEAP